MIPSIRTRRFLLRPLLSEDAQGLFALDSDPEVHRYLGNRPITDLSQAEEIIAFVQQQYREFGIGRWAIVHFESGEFIGWAGIKFVTESINGHSQYYDIGYRLIRRFWGQGIATECAEASLRYAFHQLQLAEVFAAANSENLASNRILQRIGMQAINQFEYDNASHNWYRIGKEDYLAF